MINMNKKPSEQIREIAITINKDPYASDLQYVIEQIQAILNYLDQQWEKEQPCEHEPKLSKTFGDTAQHTCTKCGHTWTFRFK